MKCTLRRSTLGPKAKPMGMQMPSASSKNWVFLPKRLPRRRRCLQNLQTSNFHRHPRARFLSSPHALFVIPARSACSGQAPAGIFLFYGIVRFFSVILFLFFYKMGRKKGCSSLFPIKKVTRVTKEKHFLHKLTENGQKMLNLPKNEV